MDDDDEQVMVRFMAVIQIDNLVAAPPGVSARTG